MQLSLSRGQRSFLDLHKWRATLSLPYPMLDYYALGCEDRNAKLQQRQSFHVFTALYESLSRQNHKLAHVDKMPQISARRGKALRNGTFMPVIDMLYNTKVGGDEPAQCTPSTIALNRWHCPFLIRKVHLEMYPASLPA